MKKQHKKIFKGKMMKNELVSVDVIHAEGEHLTADEYRRVEIEQLMQRVIDQQAEARAFVPVCKLSLLRIVSHYITAYFHLRSLASTNNLHQYSTKATVCT